MTPYQILEPKNLSFYEIIDSGNFQKLERFGSVTLARPEPQAVWRPHLEKWSPDAIFERQKGSDEKGAWTNLTNIPEKWTVKHQAEDLHFKLSLSSFKHVGIFPEQEANWVYIKQKLQTFKLAQPTVLNLFAYTGAASLIARKYGAEVTHVEAIKHTISWARENMDINQLDNIRWMVDDALKYVKREGRRGKKYNGIILDPPAYGRGPEGEKWQLETGINELIAETTKLIDPEHHFYLLNFYSMGFSAFIGQTIVHTHLSNIQYEEMGELAVKDKFNKILPLGVFYRFASH